MNTSATHMMADDPPRGREGESIRERLDDLVVDELPVLDEKRDERREKSADDREYQERGRVRRENGLGRVASATRLHPSMRYGRKSGFAERILILASVKRGAA